MVDEPFRKNHSLINNSVTTRYELNDSQLMDMPYSVVNVLT